MPVSLMYVTTPNQEEAKQIAKVVVSERLAACANILPQIHSIYHWEGRLEESAESLLLLKTGDEKVQALMTRIRALHSYETPCIVVIPITTGNLQFLDWVDSET